MIFFKNDVLYAKTIQINIHSFDNVKLTSLCSSAERNAWSMQSATGPPSTKLVKTVSCYTKATTIGFEATTSGLFICDYFKVHCARAQLSYFIHHLMHIHKTVNLQGALKSHFLHFHTKFRLGGKLEQYVAILLNTFQTGDIVETGKLHVLLLLIAIRWGQRTTERVITASLWKMSDVFCKWPLCTGI